MKISKKKKWTEPNFWLKNNFWPKLETMWSIFALLKQISQVALFYLWKRFMCIGLLFWPIMRDALSSISTLCSVKLRVVLFCIFTVGEMYDGHNSYQFFLYYFLSFLSAPPILLHVTGKVYECHAKKGAVGRTWLNIK